VTYRARRTGVKLVLEFLGELWSVVLGLRIQPAILSRVTRCSTELADGLLLDLRVLLRLLRLVLSDVGDFGDVIQRSLGT